MMSKNLTESKWHNRHTSYNLVFFIFNLPPKLDQQKENKLSKALLTIAFGLSHLKWESWQINAIT